MKLFGWLRKQYEKRLPYRIIDVTLDELSAYIGQGYYVILCKQKDKKYIVDWLLALPDARDHQALEALDDDCVIVVWKHLITHWRADMAKCNGDFSVWLRVVFSKRPVRIDDLI